MTVPVIAVVEDDPAIAMFIAELLIHEGYVVHIWPSGDDAFEFVCKTTPRLIILDRWLHERDAG